MNRYNVSCMTCDVPFYPYAAWMLCSSYHKVWLRSFEFSNPQGGVMFKPGVVYFHLSGGLSRTAIWNMVILLAPSMLLVPALQAPFFARRCPSSMVVPSWSPIAPCLPHPTSTTVRCTFRFGFARLISMKCSDGYADRLRYFDGNELSHVCTYIISDHQNNQMH